ncbi:MAG: hypothetical protein V2A77_00340 [Pseudomonadota bacterium]
MVKTRRDLLEALEQLIQAVASAQGSDEAQALIYGLEESGDGVLMELMDFCLRKPSPAGADFIAFCGTLANSLPAREQARAALSELENNGIIPGSPFLPYLTRKKYVAGYVASTGKGKGHRLLTLWRRERGLAQAFLFGLDAEGALTDFEASRNLTPGQSEEMTMSGGVRLNAKEATGLLRRGLEVARAKGIGLPAEYVRQHRFVEESVFCK